MNFKTQILIAASLVFLSSCKKPTPPPPVTIAKIVACLEVDKTAAVINEPVTFSSACSKLAAKYLWVFNDGDSSTLANPVHSYKKEGTYYIKLTVWNYDKSQTQTAAGSVFIAKRRLLKFRINVLPNQDSTGTNWDADGTSPDIYIAFGPLSNPTQFTSAVTDNVKANDLPMEFPFLTTTPILTNEPWAFSIYDEDGTTDQLMATWTTNPYDLTLKNPFNFRKTISAGLFDLDVFFTVK